MPEENEKQPVECTPEYCLKPGINDVLPPSPEEEISIINNAMRENKTSIQATFPK